MSLLGLLEQNGQRYEMIPAVLSEAQLPLCFSTRSGRCAIVGMDINSSHGHRHMFIIYARRLPGSGHDNLLVRVANLLERYGWLREGDFA